MRFHILSLSLSLRYERICLLFERRSNRPQVAVKRDSFVKGSSDFSVCLSRPSKSTDKVPLSSLLYSVPLLTRFGTRVARQGAKFSADLIQGRLLHMYSLGQTLLMGTEFLEFGREQGRFKCR